MTFIRKTPNHHKTSRNKDVTSMKLHTPPRLVGALPDQIALNEIYQKIHFRHFGNASHALVEWGIPTSTEVFRITHASSPRLNDIEKAQLLLSSRMIQNQQWQAAARKLKPLADAGHPEAIHLLVQALKRTHGNYQQYATHYAEKRESLSVTPASHYDEQRDRIVIHTYLAHRSAPRFVLAYLLYHELAKRTFGRASQENSAFLTLEKDAPHRAKAQEWLRKHGFPVFNIETGAAPQAVGE
ncbi:Hypothetical protein HDN1F_10100 [gamma proteobacterium HdN1]|nr:Hypothetical protein HDN1F_10100 [gamma proteobacterium HdN1]